VTAWGGYTDGKLHVIRNTGQHLVYAIFRTEEEARLAFADVRPIEMTEQPPAVVPV
jgi:hypothetical protein